MTLAVQTEFRKLSSSCTWRSISGYSRDAVARSCMDCLLSLCVFCKAHPNLMTGQRRLAPQQTLQADSKTRGTPADRADTTSWWCLILEK